MKKTLLTPVPARRHGYKARAAALTRLLSIRHPSETHEVALHGGRLKTALTFETRSQAYLWTTDRGRSRLIKH